MFKVIDLHTGKEADASELALKEEWANNLIYCDMEGFALGENDELYLIDECGSCAYCPPKRFKIVFENGEEKIC